MHHGQHALHQVELHAFDRGQATQCLTDQCFLGRAIHLQDPDRSTHPIHHRFRHRQISPHSGRRAAGGTGMVVSVVMDLMRGFLVVWVVAAAGHRDSLMNRTQWTP